MQRLDHPHLRRRGAPTDDLGQLVQSIDLFVGESIEFGGGDDGVLRKQGDVFVRDDANLLCDGGGGRSVITRQHVDGDTGATTFLDGRF